jgi:hypothetical protein
VANTWGYGATPADDPEVGGDYYGLPWPCWGTPEFKHPGTAILYNTNLRHFPRTLWRRARGQAEGD